MNGFSFPLEISSWEGCLAAAGANLRPDFVTGAYKRDLVFIKLWSAFCVKIRFYNCHDFTIVMHNFTQLGWDRAWARARAGYGLGCG